MPAFGQLVIGPPGSGKTTYCNGMHHFMDLQKRPVAVVNLDPANDALPYDCAVDISELIKLDDVMESLGLGPNGALVYCMEYLEENVDWLLERLRALEGQYIVIDCPGQVELFTHHKSIRNIVAKLQKEDVRLTAVHLVDAHHCSDASKFISILLLSLSTMVSLELPHVNVLSKIDLIEKYGKLAFNLEFYTEVQDLTYLLDHLTPAGDADSLEIIEQRGKGLSYFERKYRKLNEALCELIEDFSLVSFHCLDIQSAQSVEKLLGVIDKSNGCSYTTALAETLTAGNTDPASLLQSIAGKEDYVERSDMLAEIKETYMDHDDEDDQLYHDMMEAARASEKA